MINDMIANFSLITMFLFFFYQWRRHKRTRILPERLIRVSGGVLHGIFAVVLMFFSVEVADTTIVDMRQIMIVSSAYYGGIYSALITAAFVAIGRVVFFSGFNTASTTAIVIAFSLAAGSGLIMKYAATYWRKWSFSLLIAAALLPGSLYYLLGEHAFAIIPPLVAVILLGGWFTAALISNFAGTDRLLFELHRSEKSCRHLNSLQEAIFQAAEGISVIVTDVNGKITHFNRGAELMLGYKAEEMIGRQESFPFLDPEEVAERMARMSIESGQTVTATDVLFHRARQGEAQEGEWTNIRKDGTRLTVRFVITPVLSDGEIIGFMGTGTDITQRKKAEETLLQANVKLKELSFMDGLTGISNRRHFDEILDKEWKRSERACSRAAISLILLDIDFFKKYNDTYGHQLGDKCLKKVAQVLKTSVRKASDSPARYGGEEFAVILPDTDSEGAVRLAGKLQQAIADAGIPHADSAAGPFVTFSIGTATMEPGHAGNPQKLIASADEALYEAKASGRNRIRTRTVS